MFKEKVFSLLNRRTLIPFLSLAVILLSLAVTLSLSKTRQTIIKKAAEQTPVLINDTYPLNTTATIIGLKISGQATLTKDGSFLRFILVAKDKREYLVSEFSPLLSSDMSISLNDSCDETCLLQPVVPDYLRIEGSDATYKIDKVNLDTQSSQKLSSSVETDKEIAKIKQEKDNLKIQKINQQIKAKGLKWIAGETPISKMSYAEKKKLFSKPDGSPVDTLPNLQGFEYYKGGIFEIKSENDKQVLGETTSSSTVPQSWDWRNVHGENWNTTVKTQLAGTCDSFALVGALESQISLFFNQNFNLDLSEQIRADCLNSPELPLGMHFKFYPNCLGDTKCCWFMTDSICLEKGICIQNLDYCVTQTHGIPDEKCDPIADRPYIWNSPYCNSNYICNDWQSRTWKNSGFQNYNEESTHPCFCFNQTKLNMEDLKKLIIQKGPSQCGFLPWGHTMVLEGYETDPLDNQTVLIFKNSWSEDFGDKGYAKIKTDITNISFVSLPVGPFIPPTDHSYWPAGFNNQIVCVDKDKDGYCNWGISDTKPSSCSTSCLPQKDCDDSNPLLGPFDENFNCLLNITCNSSTPSSLDKNQTTYGSASQVAYNSWDATGPSLFFSPSQKGILDKIELVGSGDLGATIAVKIVDLSNNQSITETKSYKLPKILSWGQWFTLDFTTEPTLEPSKQYRIVFSRTTNTQKFYLYRKTGSFDWAFKSYLRPCGEIGPILTPTPTLIPTLMPTTKPTLTPKPTSIPVSQTPTPLTNNPPIIVSSGSFPSGYVGKLYVGYVIEGYDVNINDILTMKVYGLPPGMAISNCSQQVFTGKRTIKCTVSGTPAAGSSRTYYGNIILSDNKGGSASKSFKLVINL